MKSRQTLQVLKSVHYGLISLKLENKGNGYTAIKNIMEVKKSLVILSDSDLLHDLIMPIWRDYFSMAGKDQDELKSNLAVSLESRLRSVASHVNGIIETLHGLIPPISENSVFVKLPSIETIEDLDRVLNEIKKAMSLPLSHKDIKGNVSIKSVDNGSIWMELALGSTMAVSLIGSIAWASAVVKKKHQEAKLMAETVKQFQYSNEQRELFLTHQKEQLKSLVYAEAKHIASLNHSEIQPEEIERLKLSINTFATLINKGFEIHPSIKNAESVKNLFPNFNQLTSIESKIKKLTEGSPSEDAA